MKKINFCLSMAAILATGVQATTLEERVNVLEEQNTVLTEEILASQSGGFTLADTTKSFHGMGPAASKVYFSESPLSIGGYGEMFYANPDNADDFADVYRFITYFGYKFNDWVILNSEIEFEHGANSGAGGKVVVEFLYLDFLLSDNFNLRVGHVLSPMGLTNLRHEPVLFNTVQRPEIERQLIPSTWHENGALAFGRFDKLDIEYTAGIINALNVNNTKTSEPKNGWIRSGRLGANKNASFDPAFVGRIDYSGINGFVAGASVYHGGGSNLKNPDPADEVKGLSLSMFDVHARYENGPFSAYGLYTQSNLDAAEKLGAGAVEQAGGYYVNAQYDVSSLVGIDYKMPVFVQYEDWNPVAKTVDGQNEDKFNRETVTVGLNFFPTDQTVLKLDYEMDTIGKVNSTDTNTLSFGFGFIF